jgi:DNA-binding transcriptional LysR family regulator
VLTPAGHAFVARARVIDTELRKAHDDLSALRGRREGVVAFGIGPAVTLPLVPDAMAGFRARWPRAHVRIREGMRAALLPLVRDETLDFSVSENVAPGGEAGLQFKPLIQPELVIVGRRGHPLSRARSFQELGEANWLIFNPPGSRGALERTFEAYGLTPPTTLVHCESYATALGLIARSDVLALVPRDLTDMPLADRFVRRLHVGEKISRPKIGVFSRIGAPLSPAATAMVQSLVAAARALSKRT